MNPYSKYIYSVSWDVSWPTVIEQHHTILTSHIYIYTYIYRLDRLAIFNIMYIIMYITIHYTGLSWDVFWGLHISAFVLCMADGSISLLSVIQWHNVDKKLGLQHFSQNHVGFFCFVCFFCLNSSSVDEPNPFRKSMSILSHALVSLWLTDQQAWCQSCVYRISWRVQETSFPGLSLWGPGPLDRWMGCGRGCLMVSLPQDLQGGH